MKRLYKWLIMIALLVTLTAAVGSNLVYIQSGDYRENICIEGERPTVWVHQNKAVVRCDP